MMNEDDVAIEQLEIAEDNNTYDENIERIIGLLKTAPETKRGEICYFHEDDVRLALRMMRDKK